MRRYTQDIHIYIYMYIYLYLYVQYKLCPFKINRKPILVQDVSASTAWLFGSARHHTWSASGNVVQSSSQCREAAEWWQRLGEVWFLEQFGLWSNSSIACQPLALIFFNAESLLFLESFTWKCCDVIHKVTTSHLRVARFSHMSKADLWPKLGFWIIFGIQYFLYFIRGLGI